MMRFFIVFQIKPLQAFLEVLPRGARMALESPKRKIIKNPRDNLFKIKNGVLKFKGLVPKCTEKKGAIFEIWNGAFFCKIAKKQRILTFQWRLFYFSVLRMFYHAFSSQCGQINILSQHHSHMSATEPYWRHFFDTIFPKMCKKTLARIMVCQKKWRYGA